MLKLCLENGMAPAVIDAENHMTYNECFNIAKKKGDFSGLLELVKDSQERWKMRLQYWVLRGLGC